MGAASLAESRARRQHPGDKDDQRNPFQRDRDRVLYCSAFRRLAEVTQVVSADEGHSFHNRLTHSLKVAQIARRLAEKLATEQAEVAQTLGVDPDVTETAALAHDLGHPPFGHVAEEELQDLAGSADEEDRFEGNAQSFRIVTQLSVRTPEYAGLNLTRASLNALLKYPWYRQTAGDHRRKWGVYHTESQQYEWTRDQLGIAVETRTTEAELMDWADDIAYSVFDVDDFYRAGLIPLDRILADASEQQRFLDDAKRRLSQWRKPPNVIQQYLTAFTDLVPILPVKALGGRFEGTVKQRSVLRSLTSLLVSRYISGIRLVVPAEARDRSVEINPLLKGEVEILKQLVWSYVIENPALLTQQLGQRRVIRGLFELFTDRARANRFDIFQPPYRELLSAAEPEHHVRIVVDMISGLTERQAVRLYQRLMGITLGSVRDAL